MPFLNSLKLDLLDDSGERPIYRLIDILRFSLKDTIITIPKGFVTDLASVPRIPFIYDMWGDRAHREAVLHDAAYRIDFSDNMSFNEANKLFLFAMKSRNVPSHICYPMYLSVCIGGKSSFHKFKMNETFGFN